MRGSKIIKSEKSSEEGEHESIQKPKRRQVPQFKVRSKDGSVKKWTRQANVPLERKRYPRHSQSNNSSDDEDPGLRRKRRKGSLARGGLDGDNVMKEAHGQGVESHKAVSDREVSQQDDEEGLIEDDYENPATSCSEAAHIRW